MQEKLEKRLFFCINHPTILILDKLNQGADWSIIAYKGPWVLILTEWDLSRPINGLSFYVPCFSSLIFLMTASLELLFFDFQSK